MMRRGVAFRPDSAPGIPMQLHGGDLRASLSAHSLFCGRYRALRLVPQGKPQRAAVFDPARTAVGSAEPVLPARRRGRERPAECDCAQMHKVHATDVAVDLGFEEWRRQQDKSEHKPVTSPRHSRIHCSQLLTKKCRRKDVFDSYGCVGLPRMAPSRKRDATLRIKPGSSL